jgi:F-type H+-transporting ATPase subunit a
MEHGTSALFHIGPIEITSTMTTMFGITIVISLVCFLATRNMKRVPTGLQSLLEKAIEMLENFIADITGAKLARQYLPVLGTFFIFILISNYSGLLPLAGTLPGLAAPTSVLSVTAALAICVFFTTHFAGAKSHGWGYLKHFLSPILPLLILEEFVRPLSLSLRLYGNIFGEETVTHQIFQLVPFVVPLIMNVLGILFGFIQAMVFTLLASVYISGAAGDAH